MKLLAFAWFLTILLISYTTAEGSKEEASGTRTDSKAVVTTSQGNLQGLTLTSRNGNKYFAFIGVQYAKAPIRFGVR